MYTAEGTLLAWLRPAGTAVEQGQPVLEIETEKATHEVVAPASGIVHPLVAVGAQLKEQDIIGYILVPGEAPPAPLAASPSVTSTARTPATPRHLTSGPAGPMKATPVARRLAAEHGVDLDTLVGTGPGSRIVEADVRAAVDRRLSGERPDTSAPTWRIRARVPFSGMRRTIATRLRQSLDAAIPLTLTREVEADHLVDARIRLSTTSGVSVPFDAFFVKLLAVGLCECPSLNAVIHGNEILLLEEVNIGFAVTVPRGIIVPVIRNADTASVSAIGRSVRELTERARTGAITPSEMADGTATVTNLGDQGVDMFTPVLNPPQSCILGIGRIRPRPVVRDGVVVPAPTCTLSLTFDHRVEDGAPAARLLAVIARLMNDKAFLDAQA